MHAGRSRRGDVEILSRVDEIGDHDIEWLQAARYDPDERSGRNVLRTSHSNQRRGGRASVACADGTR
eukprot:6212689-Pleurochrysis_carterae.AAC.3